mmetsp:Transcript_62281/g.143383  ORF Transcript_62281/g.143383 Transcript_62281/m.143383 type:complete len:1021 (-) Transcript_62281:71-3133(-)
MQYLAANSGDGVEKRVLGTNPILEGFGNAKTIWNDNSSRFGKLLRLHFDQGHLSGASVQTYLLARSRVTHVPAQERNYHAFYLLCNGLDVSDPLRESLRVKPCEFFNYLRSPVQHDGQLYQADADFLTQLRGAFASLGVAPEQEQDIFRATMAVLWLGNIEFTEACNGCTLAGPEAEEALRTAADLLELQGRDGREPHEVLLSLLTETKVVDRTRPLARAKAESQRDAVARAIYVQLFDRIVAMVNQCLGSETTQAHTDIGILDIFGFENMPVNSFEQLCINFANEKLHQFFLEQVIIQEQVAYRHEGIQIVEVTPKDNTPIISLLAGDGGIFDILNGFTADALRLVLVDHQSQQSGEKFCRRLHDQGDRKLSEASREASKLLAVPKSHAGKPGRREQHFEIRHTAETVVYTACDFIEKNKDDDATVSEVLALSKLPTVHRAPLDGAQARGRGAKCIAGKFVRQVQDLMGELSESSCHYIRCIKPNDRKKPGVIERRKVYQQLKVGGMFELLVLMTQAYPTRMPYRDLMDRYGPLLDHSTRTALGVGAPAERLLVEIILGQLQADRFAGIGVEGIVADDYALGTSKVFFKAGKVESLEDLRDLCTTDPEQADEVAAVIGSEIRRRRIARVKSLFRTVMLLGRRVRARRATARIATMVARVSAASRCARHWTARTIVGYRTRRNAAIHIQKVARGLRARRCAAALRSRLRAVVLIQTALRGAAARLRLQCARAQRRAALKIQGGARVWQARRKLRALRARKVEADRRTQHRAEQEAKAARAAADATAAALRRQEDSSRRRAAQRAQEEAAREEARRQSLEDARRQAEAARARAVEEAELAAGTTGGPRPKKKRTAEQIFSPLHDKENGRLVIDPEGSARRARAIGRALQKSNSARKSLAQNTRGILEQHGLYGVSVHHGKTAPADDSDDVSRVLTFCFSSDEELEDLGHEVVCIAPSVIARPGVTGHRGDSGVAPRRVTVAPGAGNSSGRGESPTKKRRTFIPAPRRGATTGQPLPEFGQR